MRQVFIRRRMGVLLAVCMWLMLAVLGCSRHEGPNAADMTEEAWQTHEDSIDRLRHVPEEKMGYEQVAEIRTGFEEPAGIAVSDGRLYAVGDRAVHGLSRDDEPRPVVSFSSPATCVATPQGQIFYVGHEESVSIIPIPISSKRFDALTIELGPEAYATGIAVDEDKNTVYIADAAQRKIHIYDLNGNKQGEIAKDDEAGFGGFIIPSPHFDVILDGERLIATNPGRQKVVTFKNNVYVSGWGEFGQDLEGFCGCCNPTDIALLPDGRIVTSEKGLPRIKVYSADGEFETVVASPDSVSRTAKGLDLATDAEGRIYALDMPAKVVRVYEPKGAVAEESP